MTKKAESKIREACLEFEKQGAKSKKWNAMFLRHKKMVHAEAREILKHVREASQFDKICVDGYFALMHAARNFRGNGTDFPTFCRPHIRSAILDALVCDVLIFSSRLEHRAAGNSEMDKVLMRFVKAHTKQLEKIVAENP